MAFLTDRTLATGVTINDLIHIVVTGDTSQNPAGSSFKATMGQVLDLINPTTITGGTYNPATGTITFYDDIGGTFDVTGLITGFTNTEVTGFTYDSANTFTIFENDGSTHSASINVVTGMTYNGFLQSTGSTASGLNSFAFGNNVTSTGNYSFSQGRDNVSIGINSHSEGNSTIASGGSSHSEGRATTSVGVFSHAEGANTESRGGNSHSEGDNTISIGAGSHAEGELTISVGQGSHSEGSGTTTYGNFSHSEGLSTITNGHYQHAQGQFNFTSSTQSAFIIGNGTSDSNRSNLVFAAGNQFDIYGNLLVTGITSANTVVITSTPTTASTLDEVIVRDSSSGELKYYDFTHVNVGLFTQTGNSTPISATTSELTLIDGGIGSLTIPANFFKPGDSFRLRMGGIVSAVNNDTLTIRVKGNSVTLGSDIITFPTTSNRSWMLDIDFIIRTIGGVGVASIVSNGFFTFTRISEDLLGGGFVVIENTNFDTTITNTLDITAEWSSNDVSNSIYSTNFVLTKTF